MLALLDDDGARTVRHDRAGSSQKARCTCVLPGLFVVDRDDVGPTHSLGELRLLRRDPEVHRVQHHQPRTRNLLLDGHLKGGQDVRQEHVRRRAVAGG